MTSKDTVIGFNSLAPQCIVSVRDSIRFAPSQNQQEKSLVGKSTEQTMLAAPRRARRPGMKRGSRNLGLPTFIGIGSMRCGSTWLHRVLQCHPDINLGELKEVDFFFLPRMLRNDLHWYEGLFAPQEGCDPRPVRGEISPRYARLKSWQVNRIAQLLPELRIILTLRHPIERAWSQTLYDFGRLGGRDVRKIGVIEFLRQLERARSRLSADYFRTVKIWSRAFGRESIHIGFFDQLRDDPQTYIDGVLYHIGASAPWSIPRQFVKQKVWATNTLVEHEREIPEVVEWYVADQLLESTERLDHFLNGRVSHWVDELRAIRGKTQLSWRILREVNRKLLSIPEKLAYETYHLFLDARYWLRWQQLNRSYGPLNR
jgi:hypothetical protein